VVFEAPGRRDHVELDVVRRQRLAVRAVSVGDGLELNELLGDGAAAGAGETFLRPHLDVVDAIVDCQSVEGGRPSDANVSPARWSIRLDRDLELETVRHLRSNPGNAQSGSEIDIGSGDRRGKVRAQREELAPAFRGRRDRFGTRPDAASDRGAPSESAGSP
jgi:hypothetical protein